jgi:hypothetical protein
MADAMRHANGDVDAGAGPNSADASQPIPLRANCEKFKGMGLHKFPSTLEFGRSQINAELGKFVQGN